MKLSMILLLCGLVALASITAKGEDELTFYIDNGRIVKGEFLRVDGFLVWIETAEGEKAFLRSSILKIEKAGKVVSLDNLFGKSLENRKDTSNWPLPTIVANRQTKDQLDVKLHVISIGGGLGYALSITSEAIEDYPYTTFDGSILFAGSIVLLLPGNIGSENRPAQIGFEIDVSKYSMELKEEGSDFGRLDMLSTMFLLKFIQYPKDLIGPGFHIEAGGGVFFSGFHKGSFISSLERVKGVLFQIRNENSPFFELGSGLDLFINENSSLSINARLFLGNIGTKWTVCAQDTCAIFNDFDKFSASSLEISGTLRFWF